MEEQNNTGHADTGPQGDATPTFDAEAFVKVASRIWRDRDEDTRIWIGAAPSKENKARAEELEAAKQKVPVECRTNWRAFGTDDGESLVKMANAETGRRNLYFKLARFKRDGTSGTLGNVQDIHCAWLDIDGIGEHDMVKRVKRMLTEHPVFPPHIVVNSGGGLHAYWIFDRRLSGPGLDIARKINESLARIFCGDMAMTHPAGSLRVPGSFNINRNAHCTIYSINDDIPRYAPEALLETLDGEGPWLTRDDKGTMIVVPVEQRGALRAHEKEAERARSGHTDWDDVSRGLSTEGSANPFGGRNRALAKWAGKVYSMGGAVQDAIDTALKEGCTLTEREMRTVCESVARTHERLNEVAVPATREERIEQNVKAEQAERAAEEAPADASREGGGAPSSSAGGGGGDAPPPPSDDPDVPEGHEPQQKRSFNPKSAIARLQALIERGHDANDDFTFTINGQLTAIFEAWNEWLASLGGILIFEGGGDTTGRGWWWLYKDDTGVWHEKTATEIESYVMAFWEQVAGYTPPSASRKEILALLQVKNHHGLNTIPWDSVPGQHLIVSANYMVLDVLKNIEVQKSPDHWLTERSLLAADFDPKATCPIWDAAIRMTFDTDPEKDKVADMVEEWMGSAVLGPIRPRNTYQALVIVGESLGGKTTIGRALRAVVGDTHVASTGLETVGGDYGLATFFENRASVWICDDPPIGVRLPEDLIKKLVTNENVTINIKHKPMRDAKLGLTVGLFGNDFPFIADQSNAIYNRCIFMRSPMMFVDTPDPADPRQRKADPDLEDKLRGEASGILNRMLEGARRMMARGKFDRPQSAIDTSDAVHDQNAPTREFLRSSLTVMGVEAHRIRRSHLRYAFFGFMECQQEGWFRRQRNIDGELRKLHKSVGTMFPRSKMIRDIRIPGAAAEQLVHTHVNLNPDGIAYLAHGMALAREKPDQNFDNDPEVKHANDLRYLGLTATGKPKLATVEGGKSETQTVAGEGRG
jgi:hypothetical protein